MDNLELERRAEINIESCNGIQPMHMAFYHHSIYYSAKRCLSAFDEYEQLLNHRDIEPIYLVSAIQEAIGHAAALSRYFWPTSMGDKKKQAKQIEMRKKRGENLRNIFAITDESPLYNRDLRNAWEHFDEKLDTYLISNIAGHFFPDPIIGNHSLADGPTQKIFKLIDPENECLILLGEKFFFNPIRIEVERIFRQG